MLRREQFLLIECYINGNRGKDEVDLRKTMKRRNRGKISRGIGHREQAIGSRSGWEELATKNNGKSGEGKRGNERERKAR